MNDLDVKTIRFLDTELVAAKDESSGKVYVGVRWVCDGIGLTEGQSKNERLRIQSDLVLSKGGRNLTLPTAGSEQSVQCIDNEFIPSGLRKSLSLPPCSVSIPKWQTSWCSTNLKRKRYLPMRFCEEMPFKNR